MALSRTRPSLPVEVLVVGLGNPGTGYAGTRHNIGYLVTEALARRYRFPKAKRAHHGRFAAAEVRGREVGVLQPTTYMNASGKSVAAALRALKLTPAALLVVHDEIDFVFGRLQLRHDGGHGGHNGLRSLHELIGPDFDRLRLGVGRPASTDPDVVADYVLSRIEEPHEAIDDLVERAVEAVEAWVADGLETAAEAIDTPRP